METYKYGIAVKSKEELEDMMGPMTAGGVWGGSSKGWADQFVSSMQSLIGKTLLEPVTVSRDINPDSSAKKVTCWGWNFDTRWVHPLQKTTFRELLHSHIPFDNIKAVIIPIDIRTRVAQRATTELEDLSLVSEEIAASLAGVTVPDRYNFMTFYSDGVDVVEYLGYFWLAEELDVLYTEDDKCKEVSVMEYLRDYKGKGISYRVLEGYRHIYSYTGTYKDLSIFDKLVYSFPGDKQARVIFKDTYAIPINYLAVKVKV